MSYTKTHKTGYVLTTATILIMSALLFLSSSGSSYSQTTGLRLIIETGQDDLRANSSAVASIHISRGTRSATLIKPLNEGREWKNNSRHTVHWALPPTVRSIEQLQGARVTINHSGTTDRFAQQYDRWHMKSLVISSPRVCRGGEILAILSGRDIYFSGANTTRTMRVPPGFARNNQTIPYILVETRTGSDDLRNGSHAFITTNLKRGFGWPAQSINKGRKWNRNSTKVTRLNFPKPKRISDLRSFTIRHKSGSGYLYRDTWRVNRILIKAPLRCSSRTLARIENIVFHARRRSISFILRF